jgi:DNA transformation protein
MSNSPDFVAHVLDLLDPVGPVTARAMFGGHGVYARGVMFALVDDDELFLKVDGEARPRFEAAGCRQWTFPAPKGPTPGGYWRPPDEAHEDSEAMRPWAEEALAAALRKAAARAGPGMARTRRGSVPERSREPGARRRPGRARPGTRPRG